MKQIKSKHIIFILGYTLNEDGTIPQMLRNRLDYAIKNFHTNKECTIITTGAIPYTKTSQSGVKSQAIVMKEHLTDHEIPENAVYTEDKTQSTVEQLCWLRRMIEEKKIETQSIDVVSNEYFSRRVELFCDYILADSIQYKVIGTNVPDEVKADFSDTEEKKYVQTAQWLQRIKRGDYQEILRQQLEFQNKVVTNQATISQQTKL